MLLHAARTRTLAQHTLFSTILYVDPANVSGAASDANSQAQAGSPSTPWLTLSKAASSAPDDSLVLIRPFSSLTTLTIANANRTGPVTFRPETPGTVTLPRIDHTGTTKKIVYENLVFQGSWHLLIGVRDMILRSCTVDSRASTPGQPAVNLEEDTRGTFVEDCDLRGAVGSNCVNFSADPTTQQPIEATIRRNDIHDAENADLMQIKWGDTVIVEDNDFFHANRSDSAAHVDHIQTLGGGLTKLTIRRNRFHTPLTFSAGPGFGVQCMLLSDANWPIVEVHDNLILPGIGAHWISVAHGPDMRVFNNTVFGGIQSLNGTVTQPTTAKFWNNVATGGISQAAGTENTASEDNNLAASFAGFTNPGANHVVGAATFVNNTGDTSGDYRLAVGSAGRGAGTASFLTIPSSPLDRRGVPRPVSGAWDVGSEGRA